MLYYDKVLQSQSTYTTTQIAKELGMIIGMLDKRLRWASIQFRQSGQWLLKVPYQNQSYTALVPVNEKAATEKLAQPYKPSGQKKDSGSYITYSRLSWYILRR